MLDEAKITFPDLNRAYNTVFQPDNLSVGLVVPLEAYKSSPVPNMQRHIERAQLADELGFAALWLRDVPFNVPTFGDAGQIYDPFVYLGMLSATTKNIALGVASIIMPLRHPAHVAKAAASVDVLSGGRLLLGVASGDRPQEYPALNMTFEDRGERFRKSISYLRAMTDSYPIHASRYGELSGGMDMLPKPVANRLPILITGGSQQSPKWIAQNGDGWMTYPRDTALQGNLVRQYRARSRNSKSEQKPVMQSLYVDLVENEDEKPRPIHLGFRSGVNFLKSYLSELRSNGINHVALNLRFNEADVEHTLEILANKILPEFPTAGAKQ